MKLGIVGKGGTGKTTTAALLARTLAQRGRRVVAIDTDSNPNLALNLGLDVEAATEVPLLPRSLVVGSGHGEMSPADLLAEFARPTPVGVSVLHAMQITQAAAGCTCGSHASVRSILAAAIHEEADVTIVDMEAGLEHLSRSGGTLAAADMLLVVMEASHKAALTAARTRELAGELGIERCFAIGNKAVLPDDAAFFDVLSNQYGVELAGIIPADGAIAAADRAGTLLAVGDAPAVEHAIDDIIAFVESVLAHPAGAS